MRSAIALIFLGSILAITTSRVDAIAVNSSSNQHYLDASIRAPIQRDWVRCRRWKIFQGKNPGPRCFGFSYIPFWRNHRFQFVPELSDDFFNYHGNPDPSKWIVHDPYKGRGNWAGRQPGLFIKDNVWNQRWRPWNFGGLRIQARGHPKDSAEYIRLFRKGGPSIPGDTFEGHGYEEYTMGMVSSKRAVRYGYFEVESKNMPTQLVNSWWFSNRERGIWTEIDVYENSHVSHLESQWKIDMRTKVVPNALAYVDPGKIIDPGKLVSSKPAWYNHHEHITRRPHTYGLLWTPKRITYFFDGKPYVSVPNKYWHRKLFVRFDVETNMKWHGIIPNVWRLNKNPKIYSVHYFRVWSIDYAPRRGPIRPLARVSYSDVMKDELVLEGTTRLARTSEAQRDASEADMLLANYFAGDEEGTTPEWDMKQRISRKQMLKEMTCLLRGPHGDEKFGEEVKPPGNLTMHQYIRALEADADHRGIFETAKDYVSDLLGW